LAVEYIGHLWSSLPAGRRASKPDKFWLSLIVINCIHRKAPAFVSFQPYPDGLREKSGNPDLRYKEYEHFVDWINGGLTPRLGFYMIAFQAMILANG
jgi:hypothetical protein